MNDSEEKRQLTEAEIDRIVISHADDDSAWEEPILVKRSRRWVLDSRRMERAAKFYVLSALNRVGVDAAVSLGDDKGVDLTIVMHSGRVITLDVKAVVGSAVWRVERLDARKDHFLVFVCYVHDVETPHAPPDVYIVSSEEFYATFNTSVGEILSLEDIGSSLAAKEAWHRLRDQPAA